MRKSLPVIILGLVAVIAIWYAVSSNEKTSTNSSDKLASVNDQKSGVNSEDKSGPSSSSGSMSGASAPKPHSASGSDLEEPETDEEEGYDERPASEVYSNSEDALKAVKEGAVDYDDIILERFTTPGADCKWCGEFYNSLRNMIISDDSSDDEKSYYSELLAISGKPENVRALIDAIKTVGDNEKGDLYAEALELTVGGPEVLNMLGDQLNTDNELLKESLIAAVTNQGTRQAAELLYQQTVQSSDPDGFYSLGIGLGEFVPDEEAMPYVQELVMKRDSHSHLAVKALLNAGSEGLKIVLDVLSSSKDPAADRALLKDAVDHVSYDEETEKLLKNVVANPKNEVLAEFAKQALDSIESEAGDAEPEVNIKP